METENSNRKLIEEQDREYAKSLYEDQQKELSTPAFENIKKLNDDSPDQKRKRILESFQKRKNNPELPPIKNTFYDFLIYWSVEDVARWLDRLGLQSIDSVKEIFAKSKVDGKTLWIITKEDIRDELQIESLFNRKLLWDAVESLKFGVELSDSEEIIKIMKEELGIIAGKEDVNEDVIKFQLNEVQKLEISIEDAKRAEMMNTQFSEDMTVINKDRDSAQQLVSQYQHLNRISIEDMKIARRLSGRPEGDPSKEFNNLNTKYGNLNISSNTSNTNDINNSFYSNTKPSAANYNRKEEEEKIIPTYKPITPIIPNLQQRRSLMDDLILTKGSCSTCYEDSNCLEVPCGHKLCIDCLKKLFKMSLTDETLMPPKCCKLDIDPNLALRILSEKNAEKFMLKYNEHECKNKMYCQNPTCSQFINLDVLEPHTTQFHCPNCDQLLCAVCKSKHHANLTCEMYQRLPERDRDPESQEFLLFAEKNKWKRCSVCKRYVELKSGCNHITCICRNEFCYVCGVTWKNCSCTHVEENRLIEMVEQRLPPNAPIIQRIELQNRLRNQHCTHNWFHQNGRGGRCQHCSFFMGSYHFRCVDCYMRVCYVCRHHRVI